MFKDSNDTVAREPYLSTLGIAATEPCRDEDYLFEELSQVDLIARCTQPTQSHFSSLSRSPAKVAESLRQFEHNPGALSDAYLFGQSSAFKIASADHDRQTELTQKHKYSGIRAVHAAQKPQKCCGNMRRLKTAFSNSETTANNRQDTVEIGEIFPLSPK